MLGVTVYDIETIEQSFELFWQQNAPGGIKRDIPLPAQLAKPAPSNDVVALMGMHYSGKTHLMLQMVGGLTARGIDRRDVLYFDFADARLRPVTPELLDAVIETFFRLRPDAREHGAYLFLDSIQRLSGWEELVCRLAAEERVTIVVAASFVNRASIDDHIDASGPGPHLKITYVTPLSFREFLRLRDEEPDGEMSPRTRSLLMARYDEYLTRGGIVDITGVSRLTVPWILQGFIRDVISRDVVGRRGTSNLGLTEEFAFDMLSATGSHFSVTSCFNRYKQRGETLSKNLLFALLPLFEEAFLVSSVDEFGRKPGISTSSPVLYATDPGLAYATLPLSEDGAQRCFQTAVFLELTRRIDLVEKRICTYKSGRNKADFLIATRMSGHEDQPLELFQAAASLSDSRVRRSLVTQTRKVMKALDLAHATIVTLTEEDTLEFELDDDGSAGIRIVPAWKWFLGLD